MSPKLATRLTIAARVWVVTAVAAASLTCLTVYLVRTLESHAMSERRAKVSAAVETAHGVIAHYGRLAEAGALTREEAQRAALAALKALRYDGGSGYYWVNDLQPRMLMHPVKPELDGKDVREDTDPTGKRLFMEMVDVVRSRPEGAGFVQYRWSKPGFSEPVRKLSYVKLHAPWGWIVGSGLYLDDLDAAIAAEARKLVAAMSFVVLLLVGTGVGVSRSVRGEVAGLGAEAARLEAAVLEGRLAERGVATSVGGEFRGVVDGMNRIVEAFVKPQRLSADYLAVVARGEVPPRIAGDYRGDFDEVKRNWNALIDVVEARERDVAALLAAAQEGRLDARADVSRYTGRNGELVASVNALLDAIGRPVDEAVNVLARLAERDLTARVRGDHRGDFARMARAIDAAAAALEGALSGVADAAEHVSTASAQIASSSQAVASGASQQAASLEETSGSLESIASVARLASENARQAVALASGARRHAEDGAAAMEQMTGAMKRIKASAQGTAQIIRDINEIAFQTNLLALNAAVEAARAGAAGRGFAVVAEEVRSLALRSKEAANRTESLIRESVDQAGEGEATAAGMSAKLSEIVAAVHKVSALVGEMAAASREQAQGVEQINSAVAQVDEVTQQNAASSEESSSAAQELAVHSDRLATMVRSFRLDRVTA